MIVVRGVGRTERAAVVGAHRDRQIATKQVDEQIRNAHGHK